MTSSISLKQISSKWATQGLEIQDAVENDCDNLQAISNALEYLSDLTGIAGPANMKEYIFAPHLPPQGSKLFQRTQTIRLKENSSIAGFLDIYHGFPNPDIFWIAGLYFDSKNQGKTFGREAAAGLIQEVRSLGYKAIQLKVHLKNWVALRFWISMGFDKIIQYSGDQAFGQDKFSSLILEFKL